MNKKVGLNESRTLGWARECGSLWCRQWAWRWPPHEWWLHYTVLPPEVFVLFVPNTNWWNLCHVCEPPRQTLRAFWWKTWIRLWPWFQLCQGQRSCSIGSAKQQHPHDTVISLFGSLALLGKSRGKPWKPPVMIYWWIIMLQQFICWVNFSFRHIPCYWWNIPWNHIKSHKHILSEFHSQP